MCSITKTRGDVCSYSQVTVTRDGALLSWEWLNTCLLMGSGE